MPRRRGCALAVLCVLPLAACAAAPPHGPACRPTMVDSLALRSLDGHPVVTVSLNGNPVDMLLDTGAEGSVVTRATALRLGLTPGGAGRATITGIDGTRVLDVVRATVSLTGRGRSLSLPVVDLPGGMDSLAGVVGTDVLSDLDLDFDEAGAQVTLRRSTGCTADDLPSPGRWTRLPAAFTPQQRVLVPVRLGAITVQALLDSGVPASILSAETARRTGITDERVAAGAPFLFIGAALQPITGHSVRLDDVQVGVEPPGPMTVDVLPAELPWVNMLLGNEWLSRHRVVISWARRAVYVRDAP